MHRNEDALPCLPLTISPAVRWISLEGDGVWGRNIAVFFSIYFPPLNSSAAHRTYVLVVSVGQILVNSADFSMAVSSRL